MPDAPATPEPTAEQAAATMRSKQYVVLLVIAAVIGVIVSLAAWCFLELTYRLALVLLQLRRRLARRLEQRVVVIPEAPPEALREQPPDRALAGAHHPDDHDGAIVWGHVGRAGVPVCVHRQPVAWVPPSGYATPVGVGGCRASWSFFVSSSESEVLITVPPYC